MKKITNFYNLTSHALENLGKLLAFAWKTDKFLVSGFYLTSGIGAFFPIIISFIYKLLVDYFVESQNVNPTIPLVLIALLGSRYVVNLVWDFMSWGLRGTYFDYLLRNKLQNALNYEFNKKVSTLDIAHFEDAKTQDLIKKSHDTLTWRVPNYLTSFSHVFNNFVSYVSSFLILIPYGIATPFLLTLLSIPRLYLRTKLGKIHWSIYGAATPDSRRLWYLTWLLSDKHAITESRVLQSREEVLAKLKEIQEKLYNLNKKPVVDFLKIAFFPQIFEVVIVFVFAYLKLPEVLSGAMSIGDFTFYISLLDRIATSASDMVFNFGDMYENNLYVNHYFEVLALPALIKEVENPKDLGSPKVPPRIEFKNVTFNYPNSKKKVLKGVSFVIEPGENAALVGVNGAGKTTIVKLLCRFYDVSSGEILINGINIKEIRRKDWYPFLGTLFQSFMHYDFTVRENIMLGDTRMKDDDKMKKAAKDSGASEFIEKLPKKYNQLLGRQFEGGKELSQGQWQKLAIARAFYEAAPVLILDEPTSAIDAEAEYEIFKNLEKYYKDKTLILISHRFSSVRNANKIIVLDKGGVVEQGTHEYLVGKDGLYARMFKKQALGYQ